MFNAKVINMNGEMMLEYRGFIGTAQIDLDNRLLHGRVIELSNKVDGIQHYTKFTNLCNYEGNTVSELIEDFKDAVDSYLYGIDI